MPLLNTSRVSTRAGLSKPNPSGQHPGLTGYRLRAGLSRGPHWPGGLETTYFLAFPGRSSSCECARKRTADPRKGRGTGFPHTLPTANLSQTLTGIAVRLAKNAQPQLRFSGNPKGSCPVTSQGQSFWLLTPRSSLACSQRGLASTEGAGPRHSLGRAVHPSPRSQPLAGQACRGLCAPCPRVLQGPPGRQPPRSTAPATSACAPQISPEAHPGLAGPT